MGYRQEQFAPGNVYHIYNRGVEKRDIFSNDHDRERFRILLLYCLPKEKIISYSTVKKVHNTTNKKLPPQPTVTRPGQGLVDLLCFCLMGNHFHLLLHENSSGGISKYMQRVTNSYVRYFNTRHERTGPLFSGRFRAVRVAGDEPLLHVSRYIHLNPFVGHLVENPVDYPWSSLADYTGLATKTICHTNLIFSLLKPVQYKKFVTDYASYARDLADIQHLTLDL